MPSYSFQCIKCGSEYDLFMSYSEAQKSRRCSRCEGTIIRVYNKVKVSSTTMEVIDNGLQPKKIEQPMNVRQMLEERANKNVKD